MFIKQAQRLSKLITLVIYSCACTTRKFRYQFVSSVENESQEPFNFESTINQLKKNLTWQSNFDL